MKDIKQTTKQITIRIDKELWKEYKKKLLEKELKISGHIEELIRKYLEEEKK